MIIYDLECVLGHHFEGWFANAQAFEEQKERGLVCCAICGADSVKRIPSGGHRQGSGQAQPLTLKKPETNLPKESQKQMAANVDPVTLLKAVDHYVRAHFKDVGKDFSKRAIAIYEGKTAAEPIYGTATQPEQETMEEKGVPFTLLPKLPESTEN